MSEKIFTNVNLIQENELFYGTLVVKDGLIHAMDQGKSQVKSAEDCNGAYLGPGLIELHTDNLERHIQPRPAVNWPLNHALKAHDTELSACGITTVFDAMRVGSIPHGKSRSSKYARSLADSILEMKVSNMLKISHFIHLRAEVCSETLIEELDSFSPSDQIGIVSLMDHTPGQRQFRDLDKLRAYTMGKNTMSEADFQEHIEHLRYLNEKNAQAHEAAVVAAARRFGSVLASHDDTSIAHVEISAKHGVKIGEFPTTLEAAHTCQKHNIAVMMGAPNLIRGGSHSGNVAAHELAEKDLLNILSSDYVPSSLLSATILLAQLWGNLPRAMTTVTSKPAHATGLSDRGILKLGARADFIMFKIWQNIPSLLGTWSKGHRVA
ncbi:MAG: alpha-D-ribose 1-methylphosphonate 5-triphosphate diphosphatase [Paracoccaceae bacterium]